MSDVIEVALLGPVTIAVNGETPPAEALWKKHLAVSLVLWAERDRPVSRDRLLGLLWPDGSESAGRHSLNEALRVLRKAYGANSIISTPEAIQWVGEVTVDTDSFVRFTEADDPRAADLVRGTYCEGLIVPGAGDFEEWLTLERDRWRGRQTAALTRASDMHADRGELRVALHHAERAVALNPWSDDATCAVMRVRTLMGDRAGAIAAGDTHAARLALELEARPAVATRSLLAQLREGTVAGKDAEAKRVTMDASPPLLRREGALEQGLEVWRRATAKGEGATLCWVGPSGSGKSRLLHEAALRCGLEGARVALLRAVPDDGRSRDTALFAIADAALDCLPGLGGADPAAIATLAQHRPRWAERFPASDVVRSLPLHEALAAVLIAASEEAAVVIAIDDLHRFHPDGIAVLATLARDVQSHRVTLAMTTVDPSDNLSIGEFLRLPGTTIPGIVISVPSLTLDHAIALVGWACADWSNDAAERLGRRLVAEAGESVFVAVELLSAIRAGLSLPDAPASWPPPDRTLDATLPAEWPTPLLIALRHHWHQLDPAEQSLLQILSIDREPATDSDMVEIIPELDVRMKMLDRLELKRWLTSDPRGYSFASRVTRRFVAEDTMTPGQRRRVTRRADA